MHSRSQGDGAPVALATGCLGAFSLAVVLGVGVFLGTSMGDCDPGPGCHDNDGWIILRGWMLSAPIAAVFGLFVGLIAAVLSTVLRRVMDGRGVIAVLIIVTLALLWFGIDPAFQVLERMQTK